MSDFLSKHPYDDVTLLFFKDKVYPLLNDASTVAVRCGGCYTFLMVNCHRQLECMSCRHKLTCKHIDAVKTTLEEGDPDLVEFLEILNYDGTATINIPVLLPREKINFSTVKKVTCSFMKLYPDVKGNCEDGHPWSHDDPIERNWVDEKCPCYFMDKLTEVTVYHRLCSDKSCSKKKIYDGAEHNLLNMKHLLIDHAVLRDYMRMYLICG